MSTSRKYLLLIVIFIPICFLLLSFLNNYPPVLYNWEEHTFWRIFQIKKIGYLNKDYFFGKIDEGLITESGFSPVIISPIILITDIFGPGLWQIRLWPVVGSLIGLIIFFILVSKLFGNKTALLSTFIFAFSQNFFLHARTATNVGLSLIPETLTVYLLVLTIKSPKNIILYFLLGLLLGINSYFYAVIRFMLPWALIIIIFTNIFFVIHSYKQEKLKGIGLMIVRLFIIFAGFLLIIIPFFISPYKLGFDVSRSIMQYYHGRGEQVIGMKDHKTDLNKVIIKNLNDYQNLFFINKTTPVILNMSNPKGRIINSFLVPFFIIGLIVSVINIKRYQYFLSLTWFIILSIPIIFTNNVHSSRLYLSLVPMSIIITLGIFTTSRILFRIINKVLCNRYSKIIVYISIFVFLMKIATSEITDYFRQDHVIHQSDEKYVNVSNVMKKTDTLVVNYASESLGFWRFYFYFPEKYSYDYYNLNLNKEVIINSNNKGEGLKPIIYFWEQTPKDDQILSWCKDKQTIILTITDYPLKTEVEKWKNNCGDNLFII